MLYKDWKDNQRGRSYNNENEIERILRDSYAGQVMLPSLDGLESQLTEMFFEK
ncbi:hypothetical protein [Facklamia hominis]